MNAWRGRPAAGTDHRVLLTASERLRRLKLSLGCKPVVEVATVNRSLAEKQFVRPASDDIARPDDARRRTDRRG